MPKVKAKTAEEITENKAKAVVANISKPAELKPHKPVVTQYDDGIERIDN